MELLYIKSETEYEIKIYKEGLKEFLNVYKSKEGYLWVAQARLNLTDNIYYIKITTEACQSKYYLQLSTKTLQSSSILDLTKPGSCWSKLDISKRNKIDVINSNHEILELEIRV